MTRLLRGLDPKSRCFSLCKCNNTSALVIAISVCCWAIITSIVMAQQSIPLLSHCHHALTRSGRNVEQFGTNIGIILSGTFWGLSHIVAGF